MMPVLDVVLARIETCNRCRPGSLSAQMDWKINSQHRGIDLASIDQRVSAGKQNSRHGKAESTRRLQVNDEFEFPWCLNRKLGRLRALENAIDVIGRPSEQI